MVADLSTINVLWAAWAEQLVARYLSIEEICPGCRIGPVRAARPGARERGLLDAGLTR